MASATEANEANERLIEAFCDAWGARDIEAILGYFAEDAVYHNMPVDPAVGRDAIRSVLEAFVGSANEIEFVLHHLGSTGDVVFTERTDRFVVGGTTIELPVAGVFEVRAGKIAAWRDYFDMQTYVSQSS